MPQSPIHAYMDTLQSALAQGNATEHTHRSTLKNLLETLKSGITAVNEPKRIACGAPDYVITQPSRHGILTLGYIEAKDVGVRLDDIERTDQMKRYLHALPNLLLTDYVEFRWYVDGQRRDPVVKLANLGKGGKLTPIDGADVALRNLLDTFLNHQPEPITSPEELAKRLARLAHMIRDLIVTNIEQKTASDLLTGWRKTFADVLIPDLDQPAKTPEFADMIAQTLAYGLFSARVMDTTPDNFTREEAKGLIPRTNPFLRKFFEQISGVDLRDEPYFGFVEDLVSLLAQTDMEVVLSKFGTRTQRQDPVVHFYETFLAAYDQKLREARGVYYTPEPVVSYIVRSVDHILRDKFDCRDGLAERLTPQKQVYVLDPATGTGTFLYSVIDSIRQRFMDRGNAGMWPSYVHDHLLPRLFGFELLMAPYAVAHFKLSLQLAGRDLPPERRADWVYNANTSDQRLGVYLTNALEVSNKDQAALPGMMRWLSEEAHAADSVKREKPIMVVMGNPPYSGHSSNKGAWIDGLLKGRLPDGTQVGSYYEVDGQPLGERNSKWLQDDYVKFIRFGQWRIEQTGAGVLAFVTNHGYLDNPTFRGMRQQLMQSFTDIYVLNLHGNSKKKETAPDGSADQNVFDIQQGVAIGIFVKEAGKSGPATVHHADLWGVRRDKYAWLFQSSLENTHWTLTQPQKPFYLFVPQNVDLKGEYDNYWRISDLMKINAVGFQSHRDDFAIDFERHTIQERIADMRNSAITDAEFRTKYNVKDNRDWQLLSARKEIKNKEDWESNLIQCAYRPFDWRYCYFSEVTMDYPRAEFKEHVANKANLCLNTVRQTKMAVWQHSLVSNCPTPAVFIEIKDGSSLFPLYLYPSKENKLFNISTYPAGQDGRTPNLDPAFVADLASRLDMEFVSDGRGDLQHTFGPEDIFHYIYAVLHAPTYRSRYAEFLKIDFPRVPLTHNADLFRALCAFGRQLVSLHLMAADKQPLLPYMPKFPVAGSNSVEKGYPRYEHERVYISPDKGSVRGQYFDGIPSEVWEFQVGGYQVLDKWLKDRRGRTLTYDELEHYEYIVAALAATIRLMDAIDTAIDDHGGWPLT